jgi:repressor LexA
MLTPKQQEVLKFIQSFIQGKGYSPSYQEIADAFEFSSRGTAQSYVEKLKLAGFLDKDNGGMRNVTVKQSGINLPLLGKVAAGKPIEYHIHQEFLEVPSAFVKNSQEHFCLEVDGDSMIEVGILTGDHVVIRKQENAPDGTVVVASVNGEATLKKLFRKRNRVELHAANPKYSPLVVTPEMQFRIEGVLTGVLRNLS